MEPGGGDAPKKKLEKQLTIEDYEARIKQAKATIQEREKESLSTHPLERSLEIGILKDLKLTRDDYLRQINKLKKKNKPK